MLVPLIQANSDLQRFLASRKTQGTCEEEIKTTETCCRKDAAIFHKKIYGSVEALDCEAPQVNKRFRVEKCSKSQVIYSYNSYSQLYMIYTTKSSDDCENHKKETAQFNTFSKSMSLISLFIIFNDIFTQSETVPSMPVLENPESQTKW